MLRKISIVGAGRVGETTAQILAEQELCGEVVLLDIRAGVAEGIALDIMQTAPFFNFDTLVTGSNSPERMIDSDLVIVTAGIPRKPGMSRSDVLDTNLGIINGIVDDIMRYTPDTMILVVSNPVDILTYAAWKRSGLSRQHVFGQAGVLDASRMAAFIAMETGFSARDITTIVLGGHGDSMVPLPRYCTVNGIPVARFINEERLNAIIERTRGGGAEILALRKNSSAYDAPGAAVASMVDAVSRDRRRIMPAVAILDGEYGQSDIGMGVPCVLDKQGISEVVELMLTENEQQNFDNSVQAVRVDLKRL